jgi:ABC-type branched-subunit amino acid transport system permease subunit
MLSNARVQPRASRIEAVGWNLLLGFTGGESLEHVL